MRLARQAPVVIRPATWHESIAALKRELVEQALRRSGGNRTQAAKLLGLERTYLLRLMREMGVSAPHQGHRSAHRHPPVSAPVVIRPATAAR